MTRDRLETRASLLDFEFMLLDTPGHEASKKHVQLSNQPIHSSMLRQQEMALEDANIIVFLYDARFGITRQDEDLARWIRARLRPDHRVVMVANKCEGKVDDENIAEAETLGFGEAVRISAEHGEGRLGLFEALVQAGAEVESFVQRRGNGIADHEDDMDRLQLAVVGRPNVGKSTLVNALVGDPERLLTGPQPGITRDAVALDLSFEDKNFRLIDTAGLSGVTPMSWVCPSPSPFPSPSPSPSTVCFPFLSLSPSPLPSLTSYPLIIFSLQTLVSKHWECNKA